ncbi:two-component system, response regulator YesN [Paenibacillus sp. UNCCL117]|uniref:response regulator transcription factor n=1 Tax=unclassified Paenibacillus TaxID=185978 RepID=UPI000884734A|nr:MULTISPECIES: response regulator [unclassified Paenibacillus]SDC78434.1 two-component system, response regulator YesN [Paenibacillus sp. cl123]SFW26065.1 two-component system, response regulator YesN [Paenibacillus sp. UNCCL117]
MYRILIADDEPMIRKGLQKLVEQAELPIADIRTAENGAVALQRIQEERPDFLFTDIRMPKLDGLELCRLVAEMDADIQIVVISGYGDFEYAQKCLSYGVKEYLLKPVNKKALHHALEKLVKQKSKQSSETFVAVTKLEKWADRMENAVWMLQEAELDALLEDMRQELTGSRLKLHRLVEVLRELYTLMHKRLHVREIYLQQDELSLADADNEQEAWGRFDKDVRDRLAELKTKRKGKLKDPVEEAKQYIEEHLAEEVSLEEVADFIGLNASYFSQLFKQSSQETFVQYRTRRRMEKAKKLLELPHWRITDISGEVGYADHPHFTKTFKKYAGCLPSEYRQKLGIKS